MNLEKATVNCSVYRAGLKKRSVEINEISDALDEDHTFVWLGLVEPDRELMVKVQQEFGLHDLAVEDAENAHQPPKIEEYGDHLFVILRTVRLEGEHIRHGETHVFVGPRFVVTVRHGDADGYAAVRERAESRQDKLAHGPGFVLYLLIDFIVDHYQPCIDALQTRFTRIEKDLFKGVPPASNLEDFYHLKNELMKLHAAAFPITDICNQLLRFHGDIIPKESRIYYRDILDHVARVTQTADRLQQTIDSAMQVALAQITIHQNEIVKKLAGWGAILALPTMVFSLYGMNFKYMPELEWRWGYPTAVAVTLGCGVFLYRRLRKAGWL
ncbi:magnesium/cobalt transporter CorA [Xylophilus sp. GOD-11R]|uniref:magnesium/cobalt transporter CorA n=1 Tax=Xylophilus sp. GOD-11R TaxID=3089814 RepID=UPI00298D1A58|nr:magnesium/cobalt transporter CorA [Xylophilus sp. GOD-11R]WPB55422.1 magnesium/cobalt transporter CorA [Xylophilus sp. GOD-11R]